MAPLRNGGSKNKDQVIAMKRNVLNTVETIDFDKSDGIPTKYGLTDEDITCEICSQAFWYKSQLYEHLEKDHDIHDPLNYEKLEEEERELLALPRVVKDSEVLGVVNRPRKFKCPFKCPKAFFSKFWLLKHMKKEHDIRLHTHSTYKSTKRRN